jgi:HEAT repeat protein
VDDEIQPNELRDWLTQLHGPGSDSDTRDRMIAKMRSIGSKRLFPILGSFLSDPDSEFRCLVSETIFRIDPQAGVALLLPLLDDPEWVVRVEVCGLLHDIADKCAVHPLIERMKTDPDPMVRNTAAYALGGIGDPAAIPALIETLDNDHEPDELGHSASGCAATALDNILKTNHTRIKFADGLCTMQPEPVDFELLKAEAMELYRTL